MKNKNLTISKFANSLKSNTDTQTLNRIAQANPSITADIKKLEEIASKCEPVIEQAVDISLVSISQVSLPGTIPAQAATISDIPGGAGMIPAQAATISDIPGGAGTLYIETPVFPAPKIIPGISNINISPKNNISELDAFIKKQNAKNNKLKNKLPEILTKEDLKNRNIIDLFDKNFINSFAVTADKNRLLSKTILSVNDDVYNGNIKFYVDNVTPDKNTNFLPDNLRGRTGGFWTLNDKSNNLVFINQYSDLSSIKPLQYLFLPINNEKTDSAFGRTKQSIAVRARTNDFLTRNKQFSSVLYKKYIEGGFYVGDTINKERGEIAFLPTINRNITFFDYAHEYNIPYTAKELQTLSTSLKPLLADAVSDYKYYIKNYENICTNNSLLEALLPNLYVFNSYSNDTDPNPDFKTFVELNKLIKNNQTNIFTINKVIQNSSEYFDLYSQNISKIDLNFYNKFINKFKNLIFPIESLGTLKESYSNKNSFPLSLNIEFSTDNTTFFTEILKDSNFSNIFLVKMIENIISNKMIIALFDNSVQTVLTDVDTTNNETVQNQKTSTTFIRQNKRYIELETVIKNMFEDTPDLSDRFIYFGNYSQDYIKTFNNEFKFYKNLMNLVFSSKLQEFVRNKFRTYQDMISGKLAYNETLMYRIAKYEGSLSSEEAFNSEPIQNIYFANSNSIDVIKFADTQVKYDKKYTYVIYAYNMILGNKYLYSQLDTSLSADISTFSVYQEPSPIIIEEEYYITTKKIFDYPPVFPDLQFIPYKGIDNKVRININSNVGIYNLKPVIINQSDVKIFEEATKDQELQYGEKIKFKSDDQATQFEIYRTDYQPASYEDFSSALLAVINTDVSPESAQSATAASFIDDIQPNKKYYYTARAIDVHGNLSNPTEIIEIEMINQNGTIYMLQKPVSFAEKKKDLSKSIKRYIEIKPNFQQTAINEQKSQLVDVKSSDDIKKKLILGKVDQSVWGKTFVLKLISKSTGRKIDFKFKFEYEEVKE